MSHRRCAEAVAAAATCGCSCALQPRAFFVAWNGVITLVFDGFPPGLAAIKAALTEGALPLKAENFGSKWPKVSLGAVHDEAPPLTLEELVALRALCETHGHGLGDETVDVHSLSVVEYAWRGLEAVRQRVDVPLADAGAAHDAPAAEAERGIVASVLGEWNDLAAYLPKVNAAGSRASTYREASPAGHTCVAFLGLEAAEAAAAELAAAQADDSNALNGTPTKRSRPGVRVRVEMTLSERLAAFRAAVEALLPGRYSWLSPSSLHCTLRSLDAPTLDELGYCYVPGPTGQRSDWVLRQRESASVGFQWRGQKDYDAVGVAAMAWVRNSLVGLCGLEALPHAAPPAIVYATPNLVEARAPLLLLICGSAPGGDSGVWGRSLCINSSCREGAMFDYILRMRQLGWSVVVADPHADDAPHRHLRALWASLINPSLACAVGIVGHSYGGALAVSLLKAEPSACHRVSALALTDGQVWDLRAGGWRGGSRFLLQEYAPSDEQIEAAAASAANGADGLRAMGKYLQRSASLSPESFAPPTADVAARIAGIGCNFVASALPVGTPVAHDGDGDGGSGSEGGNGHNGLLQLPVMPACSAGHESHPSTTFTATEVLFEFLRVRLGA